jgi:hypothetical protein
MPRKKQFYHSATNKIKKPRFPKALSMLAVGGFQFPPTPPVPPVPCEPPADEADLAPPSPPAPTPPPEAVTTAVEDELEPDFFSHPEARATTQKTANKFFDILLPFDTIYVRRCQ